MGIPIDQFYRVSPGFSATPVTMVLFGPANQDERVYSPPWCGSWCETTSTGARGAVVETRTVDKVAGRSRSGQLARILQAVAHQGAIR